MISSEEVGQVFGDAYDDMVKIRRTLSRINEEYDVVRQYRHEHGDGMKTPSSDMSIQLIRMNLDAAILIVRSELFALDGDN